ncbi:unnamed protein product [Rhodiola kirilowii]
MSDVVTKQQLPIDADGLCMLCGQHPSEEDKLRCTSCGSPWHPPCVANPPETLASVETWECPDCSGLPIPIANPTSATASSGPDRFLVARTREIEADGSLTAEEKARKRQELMTGSLLAGDNDQEEDVDENFNCFCCMHLLHKPVTMECGHNACLKCFQAWINKGNKTCMTCRRQIPRSMILLPRINGSIVEAIRLSRSSILDKARAPTQAYRGLDNENRPDQAYTTERAKKAGFANAASGKVFIETATDYFGPILPEHDPVRNLGVLVGEKWSHRLGCRQWAVHLPPVAGIAGQAEHGAQSVVLSGGYEDDEDHGEWFLYTGSGGRDLSGNKRTNKAQSFDQKFKHYNAALRLSCLKGYPVRVLRSSKEKRSSYAPYSKTDTPSSKKDVYRYDGIYRIEKCWMKAGAQGYKVCRFLFVRCDNAPAPWSSDGHGDRPRMLPEVPELAQAENVMERLEDPSWDFDAEEACWKWKRPPPPSQKPVKSNGTKQKKGRRSSVTRQLKKAFSCKICNKVLTLPVSSPCAHNFCKPCLEGAFSGQSLVRERSGGGRSLRTKKNIFKCPSCSSDVTDFLKNLQVNRELESAIEDLKKRAQDSEETHEQKENGSVLDDDEDSDEEDEDMDEEDEDMDENEEEDAMDIYSAKRLKVDAEQGSSSSADETAANGDAN